MHQHDEAGFPLDLTPVWGIPNPEAIAEASRRANGKQLVTPQAAAELTSANATKPQEPQS